jgi:hypothetical protein
METRDAFRLLDSRRLSSELLALGFGSRVLLRWRRAA